jgi:predicted acylesterase/phospholipase RssA
MVKADIPIDMVSGKSIGALMGALWLQEADNIPFQRLAKELAWIRSSIWWLMIMSLLSEKKVVKSEDQVHSARLSHRGSLASLLLHHNEDGISQDARPHARLPMALSRVVGHQTSLA